MNPTENENSQKAMKALRRYNLGLRVAFVAVFFAIIAVYLLRAKTPWGPATFWFCLAVGSLMALPAKIVSDYVFKRSYPKTPETNILYYSTYASEKHPEYTLLLAAQHLKLGQPEEALKALAISEKSKLRGNLPRRFMELRALAGKAQASGETDLRAADYFCTQCYNEIKQKSNRRLVLIVILTLALASFCAFQGTKAMPGSGYHMEFSSGIIPQQQSAGGDIQV